MDKKKKNFRYWKKAATPYILLFPIVAFVLIFMFWPVVNVFIMSFQNMVVTKPQDDGFIGLQNYVHIFTKDKLFKRVLYNSMIWVVFSVILQAVLGFVLALMLNEKFKGRALARTLALCPWAVSGVIVALIWNLIFGETYGMLNDLLRRLGLITINISWFSKGSNARAALIIANVWRGIPFFTISFLSALQTVSDDLYEAAEIDGGGGIKKLFYITLPMIKDSVVMTTLLRAIWTFNAVDLIYSMTGGGPANQTTTYALYIMNKFQNELNYGYASALAAIATIGMCIFSLFYISKTKLGKEGLY